jgi:hypothetical protein
MYGLRIGLGGTGSSSRDRKAETLNGSLPHKDASHPLSPASSSLPNGASPPSVATSSLLSRLAAASTSPTSAFQSDDSALSHVIPVAVPSRPVPLSIADTAAEAKRVERKAKKAERRRKADEESKEQEQTDGQQPPALAPAATQLATEAPESHPPTEAIIDCRAAATTATSNGHGHGAAELKPGVGVHEGGRRKKKEPKRPLQDADEVTLCISDLRAILLSYGEAQLRTACKSLLQPSGSSSTGQSLSVKQRKEVQERLIADLISPQTAQHFLHQSPFIQHKLQPAPTPTPDH